MNNNKKKNVDLDTAVDKYEYIRQRLVLSNSLLETISIAVSQDLGDEYLGKYMKEIQPHITQALDNKYQRQKYKDKENNE